MSLYSSSNPGESIFILGNPFLFLCFSLTSTLISLYSINLNGLLLLETKAKKGSFFVSFLKEKEKVFCENDKWLSQKIILA